MATVRKNIPKTSALYHNENQSDCFAPYSIALDKKQLNTT